MRSPASSYSSESNRAAAKEQLDIEVAVTSALRQGVRGGEQALACEESPLKSQLPSSGLEESLALTQRARTAKNSRKLTNPNHSSSIPPSQAPKAKQRRRPLPDRRRRAGLLEIEEGKPSSRLTHDAARAVAASIRYSNSRARPGEERAGVAVAPPRAAPSNPRLSVETPARRASNRERNPVNGKSQQTRRLERPRGRAAAPPSPTAQDLRRRAVIAPAPTTGGPKQEAEAQ